MELLNELSKEYHNEIDRQFAFVKVLQCCPILIDSEIQKIILQSNLRCQQLDKQITLIVDAKIIDGELTPTIKTKKSENN